MWHNATHRGLAERLARRTAGGLGKRLVAICGGIQNRIDNRSMLPVVACLRDSFPRRGAGLRFSSQPRPPTVCFPTRVLPFCPSSHGAVQSGQKGCYARRRRRRRVLMFAGRGLAQCSKEAPVTTPHRRPWQPDPRGRYKRGSASELLCNSAACRLESHFIPL
jgi:hypothetical protein